MSGQATLSGQPSAIAAAVADANRTAEAHPTGLTAAEAAARLRELGPNTFATERRGQLLRDIAHYVANPLVLVLLLASGVSAAVNQMVSSAVIAVMLLLSIALNIIQSYRSQHAARRLREQVGQRATVVRDGTVCDIPAREVVPGDVLHLAAGDLVPADARLIKAKDLFLSEAALTGESLPAEKHAPGRDTEASPESAAVFAGTSVVSGIGVAVVTQTGAATQFGHLAAQLTARAADTEFERGTRRFGVLILQLVVFLVLFVFFVNAVFRRDPLESFLFAVALAVGLTPELLPMIVSVTLASGAVRMAQKRVIVKRLAAIENFGSMDMLCSDKTGTLTRGEITLERHVDARGAENEEVIRLAALNSGFQTGLRSPMDDAILRHQHPDVSHHRSVDEIPFDFVRRRVSVVVEGRRSFGNIMKYVLMGTSSNFGNMISMAVASLALPFLPMLPLQILINNFLYDLSQVAIPSDRVDDVYLVKPRRWNVAFIRRYMLLFGPISSLYDFLTFAVMLGIFHAGEALFQTGWFVESLATQTLVIFVIRTAARPWSSTPSRALLAGVLGATATGVLLPFTAAGAWLGFVRLPLPFFAFLLAVVLTYLALVEVVKRGFYRRYAG